VFGPNQPKLFNFYVAAVSPGAGTRWHFKSPLFSPPPEWLRRTGSQCYTHPWFTQTHKPPYIYPTFLSFYILRLLCISLFIHPHTTVRLFSSDLRFHTLFAIANPAKTSNYTPLQHTHHRLSLASTEKKRRTLLHVKAWKENKGEKKTRVLSRPGSRLFKKPKKCFLVSFSFHPLRPSPLRMAAGKSEK